MSNQIPTQPGIMEIALYVSGEARIEGRDEVLKLSSNENHYGCSDKARDAYVRGPRRSPCPRPSAGSTWRRSSAP